MKILSRFNQATKSMGDNSLIAGLMTLATLLVAVGFVLSRLFVGDIRFNNKVLSAKDRVNQTLEQNVAALPALSANFEILNNNGPLPKDVLRALPTSEEFSDFAKELEAIASLAGSRLTTVVKTSDSAAQPLAGGVPMPMELPIQAAVTGRYPSLQRFIGMLESTTRPLKVIHMTLSGAEPTVTLTLDLVTWWQPTTMIDNGTQEVRE